MIFLGSGWAFITLKHQYVIYFFFLAGIFFFCGNEQILRERLKCLGIFPFAAHNPPGAVGVHCHQPGQRLHPGGEPAPGGERGSSTPHILLFWAKIPGIWLFTTPFATRALLAAAPSWGEWEIPISVEKIPGIWLFLGVFAIKALLAAAPSWGEWEFGRNQLQNSKSSGLFPQFFLLSEIALFCGENSWDLAFSGYFCHPGLAGSSSFIRGVGIPEKLAGKLQKSQIIPAILPRGMGFNSVISHLTPWLHFPSSFHPFSIIFHPLPHPGVSGNHRNNQN